MQYKPFGKALSTISDLLAPLYKPLFVIYVLSTMAGLVIGSFSDLDIKKVGRIVVYILLAALAITAALIAIGAYVNERRRRASTPNPNLRIRRQVLKMKFCSDGSVEFSEDLTVVSTRNGVRGSSEWNGWHGRGTYKFVRSSGGGVKDPVEIDHAGMNFFFSFDAPLSKGQDHQYSYAIRFDNEDGFIKRFMQRASYYAPEESLILEIEEEASSPLIVRRMTKTDVYRSPRTKYEPEIVCYRRFSWDVNDPQHGCIYEIHWERAWMPPTPDTAAKLENEFSN